MGRVIIIGAGVLGLSSAVELSQHGYKVTVVARELPGDDSLDYASPWAGAHFRPSPANTVAERLEQSLMRETYREFEKIAEIPEAGVNFIPAVEYFDAPSLLDSGYTEWPGFRILEATEYPSGHESIRLGVTYRAWVLNSPTYLQWLQRQAEKHGAQFIKAELGDPQQAVAVYRASQPHGVVSDVIAIVNASGRGFDDRDSFPSRGQFIIVSNKCDQTISHHWADGSSTVIIPRPLGGGTVIGGTKEPHDWSENISDASTAQILQRVGDLCPNMVDRGTADVGNTHGFHVKQVYVARRPMRKGGLRLEKVDLRIQDLQATLPLIHCYGAGASGYKVSWGVAKQVSEIVSHMSTISG
ncbi:unnamed protein product [Penicillium olsonii]|nr:unnamed protein product [Penicillium olsonii]CAG7934342.1 unnamed protein product [Penicillium olsonii]